MQSMSQMGKNCHILGEKKKKKKVIKNQCLLSREDSRVGFSMSIHAHCFQTHITHYGLFSAPFLKELDSPFFSHRVLPNGNAKAVELIWVMGDKSLGLKEPVSKCHFLLRNRI